MQPETLHRRSYSKPWNFLKSLRSKRNLSSAQPATATAGTTHASLRSPKPKERSPDIIANHPPSPLRTPVDHFQQLLVCEDPTHQSSHASSTHHSSTFDPTYEYSTHQSSTHQSSTLHSSTLRSSTLNTMLRFEHDKSSLVLSTSVPQISASSLTPHSALSSLLPQPQPQPSMHQPLVNPSSSPTPTPDMLETLLESVHKLLIAAEEQRQICLARKKVAEDRMDKGAGTLQIHKRQHQLAEQQQLAYQHEFSMATESLGEVERRILIITEDLKQGQLGQLEKYLPTPSSPSHTYISRASSYSSLVSKSSSDESIISTISMF